MLWFEKALKAASWQGQCSLTDHWYSESGPIDTGTIRCKNRRLLKMH